MHRLQELVRLHREGCCGRHVARLLVMSPNTERKYREALKAEGLLYGDDELPELDVLRQAVDRQVQLSSAPEQEISSVEPWRKDIVERVKNGAGPTAIYDYLRTELLIEKGFIVLGHNDVKDISEFLDIPECTDFSLQN